MTRSINRIKIMALSFIVPAMIFTSCNKELEQIPYPAAPATLTVGQFIATSPSYSIFRAAVEKAGLMPILSASDNSLTVFAPNDIAMTNSGITAAAVAAMPAATLKSLLQFHIIASNFPEAKIGTGFPNKQLSSLLSLDPTNPYVRMNIFPSIRNSQGFVNNIPFKANDQILQNGVIHSPTFVVSPPSQVIAQIIGADANLSLFAAAIARGDVGQTADLAKLGYLMQYAVTNMTVLAPTNAAFAGIGITSAAQINAMPIDQVRGIVAYHILASNTSGSFTPDVRYYSVNFPTAASSFIKTLVNGSVAPHPGILSQATFTGTAVTSLKLTGYGTVPAGGTPYSRTAANVVTADKNAINGVVHIIDQVLMPQ